MADILMTGAAVAMALATFGFIRLLDGLGGGR